MLQRLWPLQAVRTDLGGIVLCYQYCDTTMATKTWRQDARPSPRAGTCRQHGFGPLVLLGFAPVWISSSLGIFREGQHSTAFRHDTNACRLYLHCLANVI